MQDKAKEEKVWFPGNLLLHEKNTALPKEIREMVRSGVFKMQKGADCTPAPFSGTEPRASDPSTRPAK